MYQKILAELKKKHAGLPIKVLEKLAKYLEPKVSEESEIENAIDGLDDLPQVFADTVQQEGDKRVSEALKKAKPPVKKEEEPVKEEVPPKKDEIPEWAKTLQESVSQLANQKKAENLQQKLKSKLKDVPEVFYKGRKPESEEEIDALAEEIKSDYETFTLSKANEETTGKPATGGQSVSKKQAETYLDSWGEANKKEK